MTAAEEICELRKVMGEIRDSQIRMETFCSQRRNAVDEKLAVHNKVLFGNGRQGMKSRVDIMWWVFASLGLLCFGGGGIWMLVKLLRDVV